MKRGYKKRAKELYEEMLPIIEECHQLTASFNEMMEQERKEQEAREAKKK